MRRLPVTRRGRRRTLLAELRAAEPSYPKIGATGRLGEPVPALPAGTHHARFVTELGDREGILERAGHALLGWEMHRRAGFEVVADAPRARTGDVVIASAPRLLRLGVSIPCRVVEVRDDGERRGMTLGTLPGHPVGGEERFELIRDGRGVVRLEIVAFSRPTPGLVAALAPFVRLGQAATTRAFAAALRRAAADRPASTSTHPSLPRRPGGPDAAAQ